MIKEDSRHESCFSWEKSYLWNIIVDGLGAARAAQRLGGCCSRLVLLTVSWTQVLTPGPSSPSVCCAGWMLIYTGMVFWSKPARSFGDRIWVQSVHSKGTYGTCQLWLFLLRAALQTTLPSLCSLTLPYIRALFHTHHIFLVLCYKIISLLNL